MSIAIVRKAQLQKIQRSVWSLEMSQSAINIAQTFAAGAPSGKGRRQWGKKPCDRRWMDKDS